MRRSVHETGLPCPCARLDLSPTIIRETHHGKKGDRGDERIPMARAAGVRRFSMKSIELTAMLTVIWIAPPESLAAGPQGLYMMTRMVMGSSLELAGWYFKNGQ